MPVRVVEVDGSMAWRIVSSSMGDMHAFWAREASKTPIGHSLVAYLDRVPAGAVVYYTIDAGNVRIAVIYYVAVMRWARGRGLGKILVASAEEAASLGWKGEVVYMATIARGNVASIRLFESMGYNVVELDKLEEENYSLAELIREATCGYEDYYAAIKAGDPGILEKLEMAGWEEISRAYEEICLKPWLRLAQLGRVTRY